jgi:cell wall-associated NlpC family hydrolase
MNRRRNRVVRSIVVAVAVALAPAALPDTTSASPIDEKREEVARITDQLEELARQSDVLAEDYVEAIDEKNRLDAEVAEAEQRVAEKQAAVNALREQLSQVAVQAYLGAGTNGFGPMFNSSADVTDGLARDQLARVALSAGTATTDELDEALADLEDEQRRLEAAREQAEQKAEQVAAAKEATEQRKAEYQRARQQAEAELGQLIREEEERRARESYERQKAAEAAAAAARAREQEAAAAAQRAANRQTTNRGNGAAPATNGGGGNGGGRTNGGGGGGGGGQATAAPQPVRQSPSVPQASSRAATAIAAALSQQGVPYRFAARQPGVAFDCSGLTSWAWAQAGVSLPHQSRAQAGAVPHVPKGEAQPGDLLFFYSPISHVSIYLGNGMHVHAPNSGTVVKVAPVNWNNVVAVGRPG